MTDDERIAEYLETGDDTLLVNLPADEAADLRATRALLEDESSWGDPGSDLAARIDAEVRATAQAGIPPVTATVEAPVAAPVLDLTAARERRGLHRGLVAVVGLAAGFVLALGAVALRSGDDGDDGERVAVVATDLGVGISGSASVASRAAGFEIVLDIDGLPRAEPGFFYQGWVKGEAGLVTIGTFHTGGHVVLWSGVDLADYPTLTVTLEPEDGDPASSGQVLLTAPVG